MVDKTFSALCRSGHTLIDKDEDSKYAEWFVIKAADRYDSLWDHTNLFALRDWVESRYDYHLPVKMDRDGVDILLLDPEFENLDEIEMMVQHMDNGNHLDLDMYHEVLDEYIFETWSDMEPEDRLHLLVMCGDDVAMAFEKRSTLPPDSVRILLQEEAEHR